MVHFKKLGLLLAVLVLHSRAGFPLVTASGGCSLVAVPRLPTAVASCCGAQAAGVQVSVVGAPEFSCSLTACGILLHAHVSGVGRQIHFTEPPEKHLCVCIFKGKKLSLDLRRTLTLKQCKPLREDKRLGIVVSG